MAAPAAPARSLGLLFGLNYAGTPAALQGCINDVTRMAAFLEAQLRVPCRVVTDATAPVTLADMLACLYEAAVASHRDSLDFVWIHYSGHGSSAPDTSGDEADGRDEGLVPSDWARSGLLLDDALNRVLGSFNPKTRVVAVFDSCHSGTICDVKYSWEGPTKAALENVRCAVRAPVITLSGCMDPQTSADAVDPATRAPAGAMTSALLAAMADPAVRADAFRLLEAVRRVLRERGFAQVPKLCSTHNLARDPRFVAAQ